MSRTARGKAGAGVIPDSLVSNLVRNGLARAHSLANYELVALFFLLLPRIQPLFLVETPSHSIGCDVHLP